MKKIIITPNLFQAIFFDFDGVICEDTEVKTDAFIQLFKPFGDEIVKKVVKHHIEHGGISRYKKIKYYYNEYLKKPISDKEVDDIAQKYSDLVVNKVIISDFVKGVEEFLEKYYKKMNFYIISGTPQKELELVVQRKHIGKYFKGVFGTPITKPDHIKSIISKYSYDREKVLYIGDSLSDYRGAKEAEVKFLGRVQEGVESLFPRDTPVINDFSDLL
ncbi:MAG: HAD family hydrolase [Thermoplasmatales archaeon]|nr:MAG: HAD family hydrolase [Thermoplasmatales archaeon]